MKYHRETRIPLMSQPHYCRERLAHLPSESKANSPFGSDCTPARLEADSAAVTASVLVLFLGT